jgi:hypothetical protein
VGHAGAGQPVQLLVHGGQQLLRGRGVAGLGSPYSSVMCWSDSDGMGLGIREKKLAPLPRHSRPLE